MSGEGSRSRDTSRFSERAVAGEPVAVSAESDVEEEATGGTDEEDEETVDEAEENDSRGVDPLRRLRGMAEVD